MEWWIKVWYRCFLQQDMKLYCNVLGEKYITSSIHKSGFYIENSYGEDAHKLVLYGLFMPVQDSETLGSSVCHPPP
jgi:hypothetical protein